MAFDEKLVERVRTVLKRTRGSGERHMFGGVCFTVNGHMACGVTKRDLMVRVGAGKYQEALARPYARPMDFTGRPMIGFVYVAAAGLKGSAALKRWVDSGVAHARNLPPKSKKKAKGRKVRTVNQRVVRKKSQRQRPV